MDEATGMTFGEFMRTSREEDGLLSPSQAAVILDVTPARVHQLIQAGKLRSWTFLEKPYVSGQEVDARRKSDLSKGGRPRKLGERLKVAAKTLAQTDAAQIAAAALE